MANDMLFNDARGEASTLQMAPPFAFSDVKMTVFPLQANLARLTQFCDGYLNQADNIVQFKPFLPFVYLIILDYGRMSAAATKTGWVSQREVAFGVPLRWLEPNKSGEMEFKDFAFTTPFIFVDNELSLSTGREVYGWPKLLARLDPRIDEWIKDPHGARRVFEIRSRAAADQTGDDLKAPFLSVTQTPLTGLMDFPTNLSSATQAAAALPNAWVSIARMVRDASVTLGGIAMERARDADSLGDLLKLDGVRKFLSTDNMSGLLSPKNWANMGETLSGVFPKLYSNTINLKQFRDAENPMTTCYQAITAAKMPITRFGGGGFLGTQNMLMGQLDGGYRVNIINTATVPIVSHLGLVEAEKQEVEGGVLSSFAPVCPFWIEIDMIYDLAETVALRSRSGGWMAPQNANKGLDVPIPRPRPRPVSVDADDMPAAQPSSQPTEAEDEDAQEQVDELLGVTPEEHRLARDVHLIEASNPFNTTRGASEALGGIFRFKDSRVRVLPLMADPAKLQKFIASYIQVPKYIRVEAWGNFVYMIVSHHEQITSELAPGRVGHSREVTFAVPVKYYDWDAKASDEVLVPDDLSTRDGKKYARGAHGLLGTAIVTPFNHVDDITSAITESEVYGVPTLRSEIVSPPEGWAAEQSQEGILLEARAIVVPSLGTGSEGTRKTLVEVRDSPMIHKRDIKDWGHISTEWGDRLAKDLMAKGIESGMSTYRKFKGSFQWGRAMALRILGGLSGVDTLSLKQFRDATDPTKACYQGVVVRGTSVEKLHWMHEIDRDLTVSITRYPTQPIAEALGLIPKRTVVKDGAVCDEFEPIRPMEIHADFTTTKGKTLFERSKGDNWRLINLPDGPLGWRPANEKDVQRARDESVGDFQDPKISYVRYDPHSDTRGRLMPMRLTEREHATFLEDVKGENAVDTLLLWRGVELGSLFDKRVLDAMDQNRIEDIHNYVRTRDNAGRSIETRNEEDYIERVWQLAGSLELVTPATIMDSLLSRGWAAKKHRRASNQATVQDFRVRRNTLGPQLAETLFPERECQEGYWPRSDEYWFSARLRDAMAETSLPHQFRKFVSAATVEDANGMSHASNVAQETLPDWFYELSFGRKTLVDQVFEGTIFSSEDNLDPKDFPKELEGVKSAMSLLGLWPTKFKRDLHNGMNEFFEKLREGMGPSESLPDEVEYFGREWSRLTAELVEESVPDGFEDNTDFSFNYLLEAADLKSDAPSPGWLHVRLGQLAVKDVIPFATVKTRAVNWEVEVERESERDEDEAF